MLENNSALLANLELKIPKIFNRQPWWRLELTQNLQN